MQRRLDRFGLSALAVLLMLAPLVLANDDKEKKIPLDKVPQAIKNAIDGRFPGAKLSSVEREKEKGKIVYDVELTHEGRKYEMDILENGTIVEIEKEIALKDVPEAITTALHNKFPGATIQEVMEVNKVTGKVEKPIHYEATIKAPGKKAQEVVVSLDGKNISKEEE